MECPRCGVYNAEDRKVCWRCDTPLPAPRPVRRVDRQRTARVWFLVTLAAMAALLALRVCGLAQGL